MKRVGKFGVSMFVVVLLALMLGMVVHAAPPSPIRASDFRIDIYGMPDKVVAGEQFTLTIAAGAESVGLAANEPIAFLASEGGKVTVADKLDDRGQIQAILVYTKAVESDLVVKVGADEVLTHTVVAGESLIGIANKSGDHYPAIYERNRAVVGDNPNLIHSGQILNIIRFAPERKLALKVLSAAADNVRWLSPLQLTAGTVPVFDGVPIDSYGNPTTGTVEITLGTQNPVTVTDQFEVTFPEVYTQVQDVDLLWQVEGGLYNWWTISVQAAAPASLELTVEPQTLEAGGVPITVTTTVADKYDNQNNDVLVLFQIQGPLGLTDKSITTTNGVAIWNLSTGEKAGVRNVAAKAGNLSATAVYTVTPGPVEVVTATVESDGSVIVYAADKYGNYRVGDEVTVAVNVGGKQVEVKTKTVDPSANVSEPQPEPAPQPGAAKTEIVQKGDSLWSIFVRLGGKNGTGFCWDQWKTKVMEDNGLVYWHNTNIVPIHVGDVLLVP